MRRRLIVLGMLACGWMFAENRPEVLNAERAWARAIASSDVKALDTLLDEQLIYTHSNGALDTKASYISKIGSGAMRYLKADFSKIETFDVTADVVMSRSELAVETVLSGKPMKANLVLLHVYRRTAGTWRLIGHQSAKLPQ
jgi:ketosteroid isomerase-like protein